MSFLKLILAAIIMSGILFFGFLNMEERVVIRLGVTRAGEYRDVPLALALLIAFLVGVMTFALVGLMRDLRAQAETARLKRENRKLLDELHHLRSVSLEDLPRWEEVREDESLPAPGEPS